MIECCPECETSNIYERKTIDPPYRCVNDHTFDEPDTRENRVPQATDDELLEAIRRLAKRLDREPPRMIDMDEYGDHYGRTYQLRFGSWSEAVEAAGFEPREARQDLKERPTECRLCNSKQTGLDFHHWRYGENEVGCYLCRDCHDRIHEGKADRDNPDWLKHCIRKTVKLHLEYGGDADLAEISEQYSLPNVDILVEKAIENYTN